LASDSTIPEAPHAWQRQCPGHPDCHWWRCGGCRL